MIQAFDQELDFWKARSLKVVTLAVDVWRVSGAIAGDQKLTLESLVEPVVDVRVLSD